MPLAASDSLPRAMEYRVAAVRRFNRFYTKRIGVLADGLLESPFSLTEVRVLWELAHRDRPTAAELAKELGLDAGYLSRILRGFRKRGLVARTPAADDGRRNLLSLTKRGGETFAALDARSSEEVRALLAALSDTQQRRLVDALRRAGDVLGATAAAPRPVVLLRSHQSGDLGWVVHRHGVLYAREYGWDARFEGLVARVVADFVEQFDPARERCWIAEVDGEIAGSVFLVRHPEMPDSMAKLRLLLVEPSARGLGVGRRLVQECTRFAREVGYRRITLWTNSVLVAARRIYEAEGYRLVHEETHRRFGPELVGQSWELEL